MAKKFEVTVEDYITCIVGDPEKVLKRVHSVEWSSTFCDLYEIADVLEHLVRAFYLTPDTWANDLSRYVRFIEGFGPFVLMDVHTWELQDQDNLFGRITLTYNPMGLTISDIDPYITES